MRLKLTNWQMKIWLWNLIEFIWICRYVVVENLRYVLAQHNSSERLYMGCHFRPYAKNGYMSGGAGYVLSKEAVKAFVEEALPKRSCRQVRYSANHFQTQCTSFWKSGYSFSGRAGCRRRRNGEMLRYRRSHTGWYQRLLWETQVFTSATCLLPGTQCSAKI